MTLNKEKSIYLLLILLSLSAIGIWICSFLPLLNATKHIIDDAHPYYEHVKFYLDSLVQGIYPLWDPVRDFGVDNEFYLRRIGEFNPAYLIIIVLQKCGISFLIAHRIFLALYFFIGVAGFYFLSRRLFQNPLTHFFVLLAVIFSSLGTLSFQSYLLLIVVPLIWFSYFSLAFLQTPRTAYLLGGIFCGMLISITYIPFYFLTVVLCGLVALLFVFKKSYGENVRQVFRFFLKHKMVSFVSILLLLAAVTPGFLWYAQSTKGEMAVVYRHSGAETANAAALHINVVNEGGIIAPKIVAHMFFDLHQLRLGDFYLPHFIFLVLLVGIFLRINRRMIFFFVWGFLIYLIGVADASGIHRWLYEHVFFFKLFRNLQFFLWLGAFATIIYFVAEVFNSLLKTEFKTLKFKIVYFSYITFVHVSAGIFFHVQVINHVIAGTYLTILFSYLFFILLMFSSHKVMRILLPLVLFLGMSLQGMEVFRAMSRNTPNVYAQSLYDTPYMDFSLPQKSSVESLLLEHNADRYLNQPFYSTQAFQDMYQNMNRTVLGLYMRPRLLLYDHMEAWDSNDPNWPRLTEAFSELKNKVFVSTELATQPAFNNNKTPPTATIITKDSAEVEVFSYKANQLVLKTHLKESRILVYNSVYHSNWRALCDDKLIQIFLANHAFMGVIVPAGEHTIIFTFQDAWRSWLGIVLEVVFVLTFIGVVILLCRRQK